MPKGFLIGSLCAIALGWLVAASTGCGATAGPTSAERQLFAKTNAICASGSRAMEKVEADFPEGGSKGIFRQIAYAEAVLAVSSQTAEDLTALRRPETIREPYLEYVKSQQQIYIDDLTAVHASHSAHRKEYSAARARRGREQQSGLERAAEIGLEECASSE
jgi:hypothetical protein